ncbi:hypothetical protein AAFC00_001356 [Neodothiora populina]|uniref:MARVEL domain-containing protein n=1 Tax=Neodothiora populina TaxID=2781224 RepID=A0ABR3PPP7_9PEZI
MALGFNILLPIRIAQAVLAIIVLGLTAYVTNWWHGYWRSLGPDEVNFLVFASVWTILALIYLVLAPMRFQKFAHMFAILAVEAVTMIFWFAGFIALAVFLGDRICFGHICGSAKAACVFAAFEWVLFAVTTTLSALDVFGARRNSGHSNKTSAPVTEIHSTV